MFMLLPCSEYASQVLKCQRREEAIGFLSEDIVCFESTHYLYDEHTNNFTEIGTTLLYITYIWLTILIRSSRGRYKTLQT